MYYPSAYYRAKARAALKGHWQTALLIALIVNLPTLMMQSISVFTGNDVLNRLQTVMVSASRDGVLSQQTLLDEIRALTESTLFWSIRGLELLAWLTSDENLPRLSNSSIAGELLKSVQELEESSSFLSPLQDAMNQDAREYWLLECIPAVAEGSLSPEDCWRAGMDRKPFGE